jgi:hypothetical protein
MGVLGAMCVAGALVVTNAALAAATCTCTSNTAGPPTLTHAVQPKYTGGNIARCPAGTTTFINTSNVGPGNQSVRYSSNGTTFKATVYSKGKYLSFTTNSPSFTVYVKGGLGYDTYNYTGTAGHPNYTTDSGLHAPYNGKNISNISHYLVCGQPAATTKASPTLSTTPSSGGLVATVVLNDTGTLAGGTSPSGTITFNLYDPLQSDCTGTPAYTEAVTVSGNGTYSTANTTPAGAAGTWSWTASYSGDTKNNSASSACAVETVGVTTSTGITDAVVGESCSPQGATAQTATGETVLCSEDTDSDGTIIGYSWTPGD